MEGLDERIRQEIDWARERPREPLVPRADIMTPPPAPAAHPAAPDGAPQTPRLRERLRRIPLLGTALAWANGLLNLAATRRHVASLAARQTAVEADQARAAKLAEEHLRLAARHLSAHDQHLAELSRGLAELQEMLRAERRNGAILTRRSQQQQDEILLLQRRLSRLLEPSAAGPASAAPAAAGALDAFYTAFEAAFRGGRDEIRQRLAVYLERLEPLRGTGKPILDLGCGRGEWLELLGEAKVPAYGVDLNLVNVARGGEAGLDVRHEDALVHLRSLSEGSLAAVTAFHLIEHLPFETLAELVDEARRVLVAKGLLILETPNPENLQVATCTFRNDPTHRQPIPPAVARFLVENRGFGQVEILRLHPFPEADRLTERSELARRFNDFLYGPQDYAVIGCKT
jgi:O-antigen chain-terminating methyltransferase